MKIASIFIFLSLRCKLSYRGGNMKKNKKILCSVFLTFAATLFAQTSKFSIEQIMNSYDKNKLYETGRMSAKIEVKEKFGTTYNYFESFAKRNGDTLITVTEGPDAGQKILRLKDSVYLFYPDAEEVIRLQGSALKDSIMGSDFTYEDLTGDNSILNNYSGELIAEETIDGIECYHVMLTAKNRKQLYQKQELWLDKKTYATVKEIDYSASGKALNESRFYDIKNFDGHWISVKSVTKNLLKKNSETTMYISSVEIDKPIAEKLFSVSELSY